MEQHGLVSLVLEELEELSEGPKLVTRRGFSNFEVTPTM